MVGLNMIKLICDKCGKDYTDESLIAKTSLTAPLLPTLVMNSGNSFTVDYLTQKVEAEIKDILVDNTSVKAYLTAEDDSFAPNNDGFRDEQIFSIMVTPTENIASWKFDIKIIIMTALAVLFGKRF